MTFKRKMLILDEQDMEKLVSALDLAAAMERNIARNYKELQIARERAEDYKRLAELVMNAAVAETVVEL